MKKLLSLLALLILALACSAPAPQQNATAATLVNPQTQGGTAAPAATATPPAAKAPKPTDETVAEPDPQEITVYVTRTGEKYHRGSCHYLSRSKIPMTLSAAIRGGYEPCKVCRPPR